jgi:acyl carrier protein
VKKTMLNKNEEQLLEQVKQILWALHGDRPERVTLKSDLFSDLGIDGDDAIEVFEKIEEKFDVDFSSMQWDRHFGPEAGFNPFALLLPSWWKWQRERVPVTVEDLITAICARRWVNVYTGEGNTQKPENEKAARD